MSIVKKSKNGRTYGGVAIFVSENFLSQHKVLRLKSVSCNLIWLRVKADGRFIIFCAIYIPPESSSYNEEDTWCILEDEKRKFSIQFPSDLFRLMGDLNGYFGVAPEVLMSPHTCTDESAWEVWDGFSNPSPSGGK